MYWDDLDLHYEKGMEKVLVIDEPEIGCGEETQLALGKWFNEELTKTALPFGVFSDNSQSLHCGKSEA